MLQTFVQEPWIPSVTLRFREVCKERGLKVALTEADRHGSFIWECSRHDELTRLITLSLMPRDRSRTAYYGVTWINVNDGRRYIRFQYPEEPFLLVVKRSAKADGDKHQILTVPDAAADGSEPDPVYRWMDAAYRRSLDVTEGDLTEEYPVPFNVG